MNWLKSSIFLLALLPCSAAVAQTYPLQNGEFESGPVDWTWKRKTVTGLGNDACASLTVHSAAWKDTPRYAIGNDRAAWLVAGGYIGSDGAWSSCGEISQPVSVPVGSVLKFEYRIGEWAYSSLSNDGYLTIFFYDHQKGTSHQVFRGSGRNCYTSTCSNSPVSKSVDMSEFWGRTGELRIRGNTRGSYSNIGHSTSGSPVYVDSFRFETPGAGVYSPPDDGGWYNPARSGQGLHISTAPGGELSVLWYTFTPAGKPVWYMTDIAHYQNGSLHAPLYKFNWNAVTGSNAGELVGDIRIRTRSVNEETLEFLWDFHADGDNPTGYDNGENMVFLSGDEGYTGLWYEPALSGWGFSADHQVGNDAALTLFYYDGAEPVWAYSVVDGDPVAGVTVPLLRFTSTGLCPSCKMDPVTRTQTTVGQIGLKLEAGQAWFNATGSSSNWARGSATQPAILGRLTYPNIED